MAANYVLQSRTIYIKFTMYLRSQVKINQIFFNICISKETNFCEKYLNKWNCMIYNNSKLRVIE